MKLMVKIIILIYISSFHIFSYGSYKVIHNGDSEGVKFIVEELKSDLGVVWGFDFMNHSQMIFTERKGTIALFDMLTQKVTHLKNTPKAYVEGQGGMLDIKLHPKFPIKPWVYVTYCKNIKGEGATTLSRFQIKDKKIVQFKDLLVTQSKTSTSRHFGSRITFDNEGFLYFSIGDRGVRKNAQNLKNHAGSILRLNENGEVPKDNPFYHLKSKLIEIWSYGHRNPQGLVYDRVNRKLWSIEHGPRGGDELNLIQKSKNYGWPIISYGKEYWGPISVGESTHKKGMEQPVHYYVPSIAPSGLEIYSGKVFKKWKGNLFTGALKLTHLNRIVVKNNKFVKEERLLKNLNFRIRNIKEGPDGLLYLSTDNGKILRLKPL